MGVRRINKFWYVVQVLFLVAIVSFGVLIVFKKDYFVEKFCNCSPCSSVYEKKSFLDNGMDVFCACPSCDRF